MLRYYLDLALISLRRSKVLTALMVVAIGLGVGASMTTLTVLRLLSGDPLPGKSASLYYVQLDPRPAEGYPPGDDPPEQLSRLDAEALLREAPAYRQAMMTGGGVAVIPEREGLHPFQVAARYTSAEFFSMFEVPFAHGRPWQAAEDESSARVVVIAEALNDRLFDGADSTGRMLRVGDHELRIVGVLESWRPLPRFYDLTHSPHADVEQVFIPFSTSRELSLTHSGSMDCYDARAPGQKETDVGAPCVWIQFWAELRSTREAQAYRAFLESYSEQLLASGQYQRPANVRLRSLMDWLAHKEVVPRDVQLQTWLALAFLVVCLVNTIGLLLAKFLRRAPEIGVRRALGASRRAVFSQLLVESGVIGLAGGLLGLALTLLGLWAVRQQPAEYAELAQLDVSMLVATFLLALIATTLAALLPAWRACQIAPAAALKTQ
jgi:putative ABC transport system permease protein